MMRLDGNRNGNRNEIGIRKPCSRFLFTYFFEKKPRTILQGLDTIWHSRLGGYYNVRDNNNTIINNFLIPGSIPIFILMTTISSLIFSEQTEGPTTSSSQL